MSTNGPNERRLLSACRAGDEIFQTTARLLLQLVPKVSGFEEREIPHYGLENFPTFERTAQELSFKW